MTMLKSDRYLTMKILIFSFFKDGSVRFWDASNAALCQVAKFSASQCFAGDDLDAPPDDCDLEAEEDDWPPFRKVLPRS